MDRLEQGGKVGNPEGRTENQAYHAKHCPIKHSSNNRTRFGELGFREMLCPGRNFQGQQVDAGD